MFEVIFISFCQILAEIWGFFAKKVTFIKNSPIFFPRCSEKFSKKYQGLSGILDRSQSDLDSKIIRLSF